MRHDDDDDDDDDDDSSNGRTISARLVCMDSILTGGYARDVTRDDRDSIEEGADLDYAREDGFGELSRRHRRGYLLLSDPRASERAIDRGAVAYGRLRIPLLGVRARLIPVLRCRQLARVGPVTMTTTAEARATGAIPG